MENKKMGPAEKLLVSPETNVSGQNLAMIEPEEQTDESATKERKEHQKTNRRTGNQAHQEEPNHDYEADGMPGPLTTSVRPKWDEVFWLGRPGIPEPKIPRLRMSIGKRPSRRDKSDIGKTPAIAKPEKKADDYAASQRAEKNGAQVTVQEQSHQEQAGHSDDGNNADSGIVASGGQKRSRRRA